MHKKLFFASLKLTLAIALMVLIAACSTSSETETPESPTQVVQPTATATTPPPEPTPLPSVEPISDGLVQIPVPESARETADRLKEAEHPPRDDYRNAEELLGMTPDQFVAEVPNPDVYEVNYAEKFTTSIRPGSDRYKEFTARVRHVSENAVWWKESGSPVLDEDIIALADKYEEVVFPINRLAFGREWSPGIDNDERIHFLLVDDDTWSGIFAYFAPRNEFPKSLQPHSNQKEMLVINTSGARLDSDSFSGKLSHELQHLIHWNLDPNEDFWLNEAMGVLADFFTGAPEPTSAIRLTNAELFAQNPDMQLTSRPERRYGEEDKSTFIHYGGEKLFMIFLLEQYGPKFINDLANNPDPGVFSIQAELDKLPGSPRFEDVFANWLVANLIDQPQIDEGQYGYADHDPVPLILNRTIVRPVDDEPFEDQLPPYGAHYYEIRGSDTMKVTFNGSTLARLTPADPASGAYAWYSSRGDNSEFTLTNTFDLTGLDTATFEYKIWYELEEFFDYAYVEVSTDGGETWQILETVHGTDNNPKGNAYGWGYTGTTLDWQSESLDLTPFVGQEILLRFQVLNDFYTNRDGVQIDDITIPELSYFDSAEDDLGGWESKGFIRSTNLVPVEWIVWLVKASNPFEVERIILTPEQMAEFEIEGFGEQFNVAAVVVSPTAPTTTMELDYELVFQHP